MNSITLLIIVVFIMYIIFIKNKSINTFIIGGYKCNYRNSNLTRDVELICNENYLTNNTIIDLYGDKQITKLTNVYSWASFNNVTYNDCNINAITEPRDQGECGSCLIFALISTVEALYEIKKYNEEDIYIPNTITELSEQYILDCLPKYLRVKSGVAHQRKEQLIISKLNIYSDNEDIDDFNIYACFYKPDVLGKYKDYNSNKKVTFGYLYITFYYLLLHNIKFQKRDKYPYEIGVCSPYNMKNQSPPCINRKCTKLTEVDNIQDIYIKDIKHYNYKLEYNISFAIYIDYIKDKIKKGPIILHHNNHAVCLIGYGFNNGELYFWISGILVGIFMGPNQAASRSLLGRMIPENKENEFYGFFAFSGKATAFLGPLLFALIIDFTGDMRWSMLMLAIMFFIGMCILNKVNTDNSIR